MRGIADERDCRAGKWKSKILIREHLVMQRRKLQAQQRKAAMVVHKPKAAPPVRMEELRALNMLKLDPDDAKARTELAQKPRGITPSGMAASLFWRNIFTMPSKVSHL